MGRSLERCWPRGARGLAAAFVALWTVVVSLVAQAPDTPPGVDALLGYTKDYAAKAGAGQPRHRLNAEQYRLLRRQRSMTNADIARLSPTVLQRALRRARLGDLPAQRATFRLLQEVNEKGQIPADAITRAVSTLEGLRRNAPGAAAEAGARRRNRLNPRRLVSPAPAPAAAPGAGGTLVHGTWAWLGPGNIGGRTRSIVIDPANPKRIWAGSVGGGIWLSEDGGGQFLPADDLMACLAVSCIATDPADSPRRSTPGRASRSPRSRGTRG
jgi:hypothetical protein